MSGRSRWGVHPLLLGVDLTGLYRDSRLRLITHVVTQLLITNGLYMTIDCVHGALSTPGRRFSVIIEVKLQRLRQPAEERR